MAKRKKPGLPRLTSSQELAELARRAANSRRRLWDLLKTKRHKNFQAIRQNYRKIFLLLRTYPGWREALDKAMVDLEIRQLKMQIVDDGLVIGEFRTALKNTNPKTGRSFFKASATAHITDSQTRADIRRVIRETAKSPNRASLYDALWCLVSLIREDLLTTDLMEFNPDAIAGILLTKH